jgi:hypothetical protein
MTALAIVESGFIALSLVIAGLVIIAIESSRVTISIAIWLALSAGIAQSGLLLQFKALPPPIALLLGMGFGLTFYLGTSALGKKLTLLPLSWLIGFQGFRIAVEILIHIASNINLAPPQMTWDGMNFDIITGVTAVAIAPFAERISRGWLLAWNLLGLGLLLWVVSIATLSFPTALQLLHPDNTWIARFPYIWLPAVLVPSALLGHIAIFRKLFSHI